MMTMPMGTYMAARFWRRLVIARCPFDARTKRPERRLGRRVASGLGGVTRVAGRVVVTAALD